LTKIVSLENTIFGLKMSVKKYFEIPRAPSELLLEKSAQKGLAA